MTELCSVCSVFEVCLRVRACASRQPGKRNMCSSVRGNTLDEHGNPVFECVLCSRITKVIKYFMEGGLI